VFSNRTGSFSSEYLSWQPYVADDGAGAVAGPEARDLSISRVLASGAAGHPRGTGAVRAGLTLDVPVDVVSPGTYQATITLTVLS
jgi:hypothetical protein